MSSTADVDLYPVNVDHPAPAVLVLPGGGFGEHTAHDGEGYARWLNSLGFAAVVLRDEVRSSSASGRLHALRSVPQVQPSPDTTATYREERRHAWRAVP